MSRHGKRRRVSPEEEYDSDTESYDAEPYEDGPREAGADEAGAAEFGAHEAAPDEPAPDVPEPEADRHGRIARPTPEPLEADDIKIVSIGTVAWFVLFLASLPFRDTLERNDHEWWPWCALAGSGLGLLGLWYLRRRREAIRRRANG